MMKRTKKNMVKCPSCGKLVQYQGNPYRPFCSQRCKLVDLEGWFSERYRISTPAVTEMAIPETSAQHTDNQS